MGQAKLLLAFDGVPLIGRVVAALREGGAEPVLVVAPPADAPEGPSVAQAAAAAGAVVITPQSRPPEMRDSVELAIGHLQRAGPPAGLLLAPGDSPAITKSVVRHILLKWRGCPDSIVVPLAARQRAHPIVLPWDLARTIASLPADQGINGLLRSHPARVVEIDVDSPQLADDLDSPADLERWRSALDSGRQRASFPLAVRLFAIARQRAGRSVVEIQLTSPATVGDLRAAMAAQYSELAVLAARAMVAVDSEYAGEATVLVPDSEVALIPPVSGGGTQEKSCP
jgi:CTP:molybdopterin cytidylyltransferase MocA/molybdopterin converting factor small subunit